MQNKQQQQQHQQQQQQQRPPMMRSATEHDIKIRNRRSMAVGPFEDLPPHIRQHMVRSNFRFCFRSTVENTTFRPATVEMLQKPRNLTRG